MNGTSLLGCGRGVSSTRDLPLLTRAKLRAHPEVFDGCGRPRVKQLGVVVFAVLEKVGSRPRPHARSPLLAEVQRMCSVAARSSQRGCLIHPRVNSTVPRTREPATPRVLSVNTRRLMPTATKSVPATDVEFSAATGASSSLWASPQDAKSPGLTPLAVRFPSASWKTMRWLAAVRRVDSRSGPIVPKTGSKLFTSYCGDPSRVGASQQTAWSIARSSGSCPPDEIVHRSARP